MSGTTTSSLPIAVLVAWLGVLPLVPACGGPGGSVDSAPAADTWTDAATDSGGPDAVDACPPAPCDVPGEAEAADPCRLACGDGACDPLCGEAAESCPADCCTCGDDTCDPLCGEGWGEALWTCASDCAPCGNDTCDPGEGPLECPADCCGPCGDGECRGGLCGEDADGCPEDCHQSSCGNAVCEPGENPVDCPLDCEPYQCGNGTCEPGEDPGACPDDCAASCGDCACDKAESYDSCPLDCGFCGDGYCIAACAYAPEAPATCPMDCCAPDCEGRVCGGDGCGGSCGECPQGTACAGDGLCVDCAPVCDGETCGPDGCGGSCEECPEGSVCVQGGTCLCIPDCLGAACGDDGCGGNCGDCGGPQEICEEGACVCQPDCLGAACGDDGCGGNCGACEGVQEVCAEGQCVCHPDCGGDGGAVTECGPDGCGGNCGDCAGPQEACVDGLCLCQPDCAATSCGDDGCGGSCGPCPPGWTCGDSACECVAECSDKICGDDGCGGSCGLCPGEQLCMDDGQTCLCVPDCADKACGGDGCGGNCGLCPPGWTCDEDGYCLDLEAGLCKDGNDTDWDGCTGWQITEFQVNTWTQGHQDAPAVATLPDLRWVVVWQSEGQDDEGDGRGIYSRRFHYDGYPDGPEHPVNTSTAGSQELPAVASLPDGSYVVAWLSIEDNGQTYRIVARRMVPGGADGEEIQVNTSTGYVLGAPVVAADPDNGDFVVTWARLEAEPNGWRVMFRKFHTFTEPPFEEYPDEAPVAPAAGSAQQAPAVAMSQLDIAMVAWEGPKNPGWEDFGIHGRMVDGLGEATGQSFHVSPFAWNATDHHVRLARHPYGGFVVAWAACPAFGAAPEEGPDGSQCGVYANYYETDGTINDDVLLVNTTTPDDQSHPAVAIAPLGTVLMAWRSVGQDCEFDGVFGQRVGTGGTPLGSEFQINTYCFANQLQPAVAAFDSGNFAVAWTSEELDGSGRGVFVQRYDADGKKVYH